MAQYSQSLLDDIRGATDIVIGVNALDYSGYPDCRPEFIAQFEALANLATKAGVEGARFRVHAPLAYPDLVAATLASAGVVTDSGGLQKEAFLLRVPCTTVRSETEWVETVALGWNVLARTPDEIVAAVQRPAPEPTAATPYGDGDAARRVVETVNSVWRGESR